jgi:hypothetical protein
MKMEEDLTQREIRWWREPLNEVDAVPRWGVHRV